MDYSEEQITCMINGMSDLFCCLSYISCDINIHPIGIDPTDISKGKKYNPPTQDICYFDGFVSKLIKLTENGHFDLTRRLVSSIYRINKSKFKMYLVASPNYKELVKVCSPHIMEY